MKNPLKHYKFINELTIEPPPECWENISNVNTDENWLKENNYKPVNESEHPNMPYGGFVKYIEHNDSITKAWIAYPPPEPIQEVIRYATKKIIEKMVAENIIGTIREALITANMYEILLLEPILSMDDPRLTAALEIITPIAAQLGIADIAAWLEPCKI